MLYIFIVWIFQLIPINLVKPLVFKPFSDCVSEMFFLSLFHEDPILLSDAKVDTRDVFKGCNY